MDIIGPVEKFEKTVYAALMVLLMVVVLAAIADLIVYLYKSLWEETPYLLESHEMLLVLGAFLLVLIGVELLDTIKAYFRENTIHVEIVVLLAIIAVARKVILLDPYTYTTSLVDGKAVTTAVAMSGYEFGIEMMGIGVILICLGAGYYLIKRAGIVIGPGGISRKEE
ncbi:MAG: phosphate-starvation-inducible PsiE family protein [Methanoregula sp.]|nr:phosphate-starvation-inducible PsiE family protein [Methanoregula sp.]